MYRKPKYRIIVFFRFGEYICITSTDIKGGEKTPQKITKAVPEEREPLVAPEKANLGKKETQSKPSTQKDHESNVEYVVRKVGEKLTIARARKCFLKPCTEMLIEKSL